MQAAGEPAKLLVRGVELGKRTLQVALAVSGSSRRSAAEMGGARR
jgi:hypothetical protein